MNSYTSTWKNLQNVMLTKQQYVTEEYTQYSLFYQVQNQINCKHTA